MIAVAALATGARAVTPRRLAKRHGLEGSACAPVTAGARPADGQVAKIH